MDSWQQLQLPEAVQESPSDNLEMTNMRNCTNEMRFQQQPNTVLQTALKYTHLFFKDRKKNQLCMQP